MYKTISKSAIVFLLSCVLLCTSTLVFSQKKILFVVSNQDHYGNSNIRTANHFGEIAVPYDGFTKAGYVVDFVSPKGGAVPIGYINAADSIHKKYLYNGFFMSKLKNTMKPADVVAENYSVIFYGGGGAAMFGVAENIEIQSLAKQIYNQSGIISAICHGTAGLAYLKDNNGKSIYSGKRITGFADKFEEREEEYYKTFPFAIDEAIRNNEGNFVHTDNLGDGFYVVDGRFVTGQDPSSASEMTTEIISLLEKSNPDVSQESIKNLDKVFADYSGNKPGVGAGLLKDGQIVYLKGFGSADVEQQIPVDVDTKFQIGVMSRQFTAFAVLLLEEQGKISLSDDVRKYIPQLPDYGQVVTLKHLLSQSSGLHDFNALKDISAIREKDVFTQEDALNLIFLQKELDYKPGTRFSQTASGLILLTEVIKKVSGQTFAAFTEEHIFKPLGMTNTLFLDDNEKMISNVAKSYQVTKNGLKHNLINHSVVGTTNLYTSAADMSRWYLNFQNPKLGSKKLIEKLNSPVTLDDNRTTFNPTAGRLLHGQQFLHAERGVPKIWTYGLEGGYASNIFIFPNQNVISFVLGNNNRYNGGPTMNMALEILGDIFPEPAVIDFSKLKTLKLSAKQLNNYAGNYWDYERMAGLNLFVKNDTLHFKNLGNASEELLVPIAKDVFQMVVDGDDVIKVKFKRDENILKLIYTSGESDEYVYQKYTEKTYSSTELNEFNGTYYNKSLNVSYTLEQNGKGLSSKNKNHKSINYQPVETDLFVSNARNLGSIRFKRDNQKRVTGYYINSDRLKNLFFEKQ